MCFHTNGLLCCLWKSTIYEMKLCKIKQHFSVSTLDRALTRVNTDVGFLGLQESLTPAFSQHLSGCLESVDMVWMLVWWPAESSCSWCCHPSLVLSCSEDAWALRKCCFCCLWVPYSLNTVLSVLLVCGEGSGSFKSVCELLKSQAICLKIWWAYGLLMYGELCTLFSVSKELVWCVYSIAEETKLFSQIHRV